jgi:hypothetical protein
MLNHRTSALVIKLLYNGRPPAIGWTVAAIIINPIQGKARTVAVR